LIAREQQPTLFPIRKSTAHGIERGPRDVSNILAPQGKTYGRSKRLLSAELPDQAKYRVSYTSFDGLRGDFPEAILQLSKTSPHDSKSIQRNLRMAVYQPDQICFTPAYHDGRRHCIGIRGISMVSKGSRDSKYFADPNESDDYLRSIATRL